MLERFRVPTPNLSEKQRDNLLLFSIPAVLILIPACWAIYASYIKEGKVSQAELDQMNGLLPTAGETAGIPDGNVVSSTVDTGSSKKNGFTGAEYEIIPDPEGQSRECLTIFQEGDDPNVNTVYGAVTALGDPGALESNQFVSYYQMDNDGVLQLAGRFMAERVAEWKKNSGPVLTSGATVCLDQ